MDKAKTHLSVWYEIFAPDDGNGKKYSSCTPTVQYLLADWQGQTMSTNG